MKKSYDFFDIAIREKSKILNSKTQYNLKNTKCGDNTKYIKNTKAYNKIL